MQAGRARVKRELLAETNGPYITSELSLFWSYELEPLTPLSLLSSLVTLWLIIFTRYLARRNAPPDSSNQV
jgi:hypothetical protein